MMHRCGRTGEAGGHDDCRNSPAAWRDHIDMPTSTLRLVALALCMLVAISIAAAQDSTAFNGFNVSGALVPADKILRGGPPKDGIPAIDAPKFVAPAAAGLKPDDRVLGVSYAGIARAYPVRIMNWHEVVNDRFGDAMVAVTYCPLCGTGIAFDARVGPYGLSFGVSGLLYNSDVLLYDRATKSLWSQLKQQAITGMFRGASLKPLPLEHTSWADWLARHPDTQVLSTDTGFARDYARDPYAGYDTVPRLLFEVEHRDARFGPKEWVLGVEVGGVHKAYPFSVLERGTTGASAVVTDTVNGKTIRVRFDPRHRTARAFDAQDKPLPGVMAFWFAWAAFHPNTEVYHAP
jgi:hypothetical protein